METVFRSDGLIGQFWLVCLFQASYRFFFSWRRGDSASRRLCHRNRRSTLGNRKSRPPRASLL